MSNRKTTSSLADLKQDPANLNKHAERGAALTRRSIEKFGARLAGVVDRNGVIIDGNDRFDAYAEVDLTEVQIIEADPERPVYLKFEDLDLSDPTNPARELQLALHRSAAESFMVDPGALLEHLQTGLEVGDWYRDKELDRVLASIQLEFEGAVELADDEEEAEELPTAIGPSHVRMVQLFFNTTTQPEFVRLATALAAEFRTDNLTDTTMEAVRYAYRALIERDAERPSGYAGRQPAE